MVAISKGLKSRYLFNFFLLLSSNVSEKQLTNQVPAIKKSGLKRKGSVTFHMQQRP